MVLYCYLLHCQVLQPRYVQFTRHGLDWIRVIENFVEIGLDRYCKTHQNLPPGLDLDLVNRKKCGIYVVKSLHFPNILDFIWTWSLYLKKFLDCVWTWIEF